MFKKILIANRGEIACRVVRTLRKMGISSIAICSIADTGALHATLADEVYNLNSDLLEESYLDIQKIIQIAHQCGAEAIHPGYGFLSENSVFAKQCEQEGITFIGPTSDNLNLFGLKHEARKLAKQIGMYCLPASSIVNDLDEALKAADIIGYPIILKCTAGGGGIGMRVCMNPLDLSNSFEETQRLGMEIFKCKDIFLEKYLADGRHIEVQIFGDGKGNIAILGERECSIQRRKQKIIEETPSPFVTSALRNNLFKLATQLTELVRYRSAGTVEFLIDVKTEVPYFLEVNPRLQVEHGVTELVFGIDLVEWMIRLSAGEELNLSKHSLQSHGHSIQTRIYAEVPEKNFQPCVGVVTEVIFPEEARIDTCIEKGLTISAQYDHLLAKLIVHGTTRQQALKKMTTALMQTRISGVQTNLHYLKEILNSKLFRQGLFSTEFLDTFDFTSPVIEVLSPGVYTTIQDYPGRLKYWSIGIPPSGPMDPLAFRIANKLVGNEEGMAGLELTGEGPSLKFYCDTLIAITGAPIKAKVDEAVIPLWSAFIIKKGSILSLSASQKQGCRSYIAFKDGIDVPLYLGSRSTFVLGKIGGIQGRPFRQGDFFQLNCLTTYSSNVISLPTLLRENTPNYCSAWKIGVMIGPHGSPDFFTDIGLNTFFQSQWKVHYNSNRLGIRLIGPKLEWARKDGGEAGLHPSNIHDYVYAVGSINISGDMPIILTCDGPSLGGFVCPVTIVTAELWKIGQVKPGDTIEFVLVNRAWALLQEKNQNNWINTIGKNGQSFNWNYHPEQLEQITSLYSDVIIHRIPSTEDRPEVTYRQVGDKYILIEYGIPIFDLSYRFRVYLLMRYFDENAHKGIIELSPGVRSLRIHFDNQLISFQQLINILILAENHLPKVEEVKVPTRIFELPLVFDDKASQEAVERYRQSVRKTAPYLPSNIEFIRRINGLSTVDDIKKVIYRASYLVLGLGDVYLGSPCTVPIDPRDRLITSKYNPARTFTPEGAIGIGGVYMCMYAVESPGGYQLVGRTIPIWDIFAKNSNFNESPWLFRYFDQIRFYEASEEELQTHRESFYKNKFTINMKEEEFILKDYYTFLESIQDELQDIKKQQKEFFEAERIRWQTDDMDLHEDISGANLNENNSFYEIENIYKVTSSISGSVQTILAQIGMYVEKGTPILILEAMKIEFTVYAEESGLVRDVRCQKGQLVQQGDLLFLFDLVL